MEFNQAAIKVEKEREFEQLKAAIGRAFSGDHTLAFLKRVQSRGMRIRDFDAVLAKGVIDDVDQGLANAGKRTQQSYQEMATSDQAQIREWYLTKVEEVDPELRARFHKLYQYY